VRCFEDSNVHHVSATIDPVRDIEVINTELALADLASLQKRRDRLQKQLHAGDKTAKIENAVIEKVLEHLDAGRPAITAELSPEEKTIVRGFFLLTSKPTIFACNVAETDLAAAADEVSGPGYNVATRVKAVEDYARHHFATEAIVTIHEGDKAPTAAGTIHSDFERGFIAAETIHYDDLVELGSFAKAREAGKLRLEGKDYVVRDGDVILFRFNV
jgi:ribosome-binding ATPase YchF (GTP1/OBG family)